MSPVLSSPHFNDRFGSVDDAPSKSLTPQRKHRKLLKDGSGIEVWPESVEKIFVEGLFSLVSWHDILLIHVYLWCRTPQVLGIPICDVIPVPWQKQMAQPILSRLFEECRCGEEQEASCQPYTSFAQYVEGRARFVCSPVRQHALILQLEFHLVAGGDELFSELSHSNVKQEEQGDSLAFGYDDGDDSSNGTPPFSSPSDVKTEFPPSPGIPLCTFPPDVQTYYAPMSNGISMSSSMLPTASSNAQRSYSMNMGTTEFSTSATPYDFSAPPNFVSHGQFSPETMPSQAMSHRHTGKAARVKALRLAAEGIAPLWVRLDALISLGQLAPHTPLSLKFQLGTSRLNTSSCFAPSLYFTSWTCSEKCITKLFINGQMNSSEDSPLAWTSSGEGYATAALPESRLSQCRWLDPCKFFLSRCDDELD